MYRSTSVQCYRNQTHNLCCVLVSSIPSFLLLKPRIPASTYLLFSLSPQHCAIIVRPGLLLQYHCTELYDSRNSRNSCCMPERINVHTCTCSFWQLALDGSLLEDWWRAAAGLKSTSFWMVITTDLSFLFLYKYMYLRQQIQIHASISISICQLWQYTYIRELSIWKHSEKEIHGAAGVQTW